MVRRNKRLQLQGVEGRLLPGRHRGGRHAGLLRVQAAGGGDQQHVLPDAETERAGHVARLGAGRLSFLHQGVAADHASGEAQGLRGSRGLPGGRARDLGRQARVRAVPATAVSAQGRRAAGRFPINLAQGVPGRDGVPPCLLVRRRDDGNAQAARRGDLRIGGRRIAHAGARGDNGLGLPAPAQAGLRRRGARRLGRPCGGFRCSTRLRLLQARRRWRRTETGQPIPRS